MKETPPFTLFNLFLFIILLIAAFIFISFIGYFLIGFMDWICSDPLDIINNM